MIQVKQLIKNFGNGEVVTKVLRGINLHIKKGEFVAIQGKSGAGKSTLLYQMSILDMPTSGQIILDGINTEHFSETERTDFRLNRLGYIFQDYALIPELSAVENVVIPILMLGTEKRSAMKQAMSALDAVGLANRHDNLPSQLSGGEQQRVSIARAIAHTPDILFADEPTANLDSVSGTEVMRVINDLHKQNGQTIVMVTHEPEYAAYADRLIEIQDGMVVSDKPQKGAH